MLLLEVMLLLHRLGGRLGLASWVCRGVKTLSSLACAMSETDIQATVVTNNTAVAILSPLSSGGSATI